MIFKKTSNKRVSVTHESKKTVVIVNGEEIDLSNVQSGDIDLISLLRNQGLDMDLIPESMLSTISNSLESNTIKPNVNSKIKVDCSSCNRSVSYGKGNCLYCGNPLTLPQSSKSDQVANEVDAKYLNTSEIESNDKITDSDINYIDRLKDI